MAATGFTMSSFLKVGSKLKRKRVHTSHKSLFAKGKNSCFSLSVELAELSLSPRRSRLGPREEAARVFLKERNC